VVEKYAFLLTIVIKFSVERRAYHTSELFSAWTLIMIVRFDFTVGSINWSQTISNLDETQRTTFTYFEAQISVACKEITNDDITTGIDKRNIRSTFSFFSCAISDWALFSADISRSFWLGGYKDLIFAVSGNSI
jgi:hypothetical protein